MPTLWLSALLFTVKAASVIKAGVMLVLMHLLFIADMVVATLDP